MHSSTKNSKNGSSKDRHPNSSSFLNSVDQEVNPILSLPSFSPFTLDGHSIPVSSQSQSRLSRSLSASSFDSNDPESQPTTPVSNPLFHPFYSNNGLPPTPRKEKPVRSIYHPPPHSSSSSSSGSSQQDPTRISPTPNESNQPPSSLLINRPSLAMKRKRSKLGNQLFIESEQRETKVDAVGEHQLQLQQGQQSSLDSLNRSARVSSRSGLMSRMDGEKLDDDRMSQDGIEMDGDGSEVDTTSSRTLLWPEAHEQQKKLQQKIEIQTSSPSPKSKSTSNSKKSSSTAAISRPSLTSSSGERTTSFFNFSQRNPRTPSPIRETASTSSPCFSTESMSQARRLSGVMKSALGRSSEERDEHEQEQDHRRSKKSRGNQPAAESSPDYVKKGKNGGKSQSGKSKGQERPEEEVTERSTTSTSLSINANPNSLSLGSQLAPSPPFNSSNFLESDLESKTPIKDQDAINSRTPRAGSSSTFTNSTPTSGASSLFSTPLHKPSEGQRGGSSKRVSSMPDTPASSHLSTPTSSRIKANSNFSKESSFSVPETPSQSRFNSNGINNGRFPITPVSEHTASQLHEKTQLGKGGRTEKFSRSLSNSNSSDSINDSPSVETRKTKSMKRKGADQEEAQDEVQAEDSDKVLRREFESAHTSLELSPSGHTRAKVRARGAFSLDGHQEDSATEGTPVRRKSKSNNQNQDSSLTAGTRKSPRIRRAGSNCNPQSQSPSSQNSGRSSNTRLSRKDGGNSCSSSPSPRGLGSKLDFKRSLSERSLPLCRSINTPPPQTPTEELGGDHQDLGKEIENISGRKRKGRSRSNTATANGGNGGGGGAKDQVSDGFYTRSGRRVH